MAATGGDQAADDDYSSGLIRFEVDVKDVTASGKFSPQIEVMGIPWKLGAYKGASKLEVYLYHRQSDSNSWSFDVAAQLRLVNSKDDEYSQVGKFTKTFSHKVTSWGYDDFISWNDVIEREKGFINDNRITLEARFTLSNIVGISTIPRTDFTNANDPCHDVALLIDGRKLYASKQVLAVHSPVFKAMFYGNFGEKDRKEVELKGIYYEEFLDLLNLIYPSYHKITEDSAEYLLIMADRYQIQTITDRVEKFYIDSDKFPVATKLRLADQYRLVKLQDHCLASFTTVGSIMRLKASEDFDALSNAAMASLLLKAMKLN